MDTIKKTKGSILEVLKGELEDITEEKEIYFHDIVTGEVDNFTPTNRKECLKLIDQANEEHFDSGLTDNSRIDRTLITMAYQSIEQGLFNDDFIQELQDLLNNETITKAQAKKIVVKIEAEESREGFKTHLVKYEDNSTQLYFNERILNLSSKKGN